MNDRGSDPAGAETPPNASASNASGASRFRKRPVVVEAIRWTGENYDAVCAFVGKPVPYWTSAGDRSLAVTLASSERDGWTNRSDQRAFIGDWIARATEGRLAVCTAKEFAATYEPADATPREPEPLATPQDAPSNGGAEALDDDPRSAGEWDAETLVLDWLDTSVGPSAVVGPDDCDALVARIAAFVNARALAPDGGASTALVEFVREVANLDCAEYPQTCAPDDVCLACRARALADLWPGRSES